MVPVGEHPDTWWSELRQLFPCPTLDGPQQPAPPTVRQRGRIPAGAVPLPRPGVAARPVDPNRWTFCEFLFTNQNPQICLPCGVGGEEPLRHCVMCKACLDVRIESAITAAAGTRQPPMVQCPSCGRTFPVPKLRAALRDGCLNYPVGDDGQYPRAYQLNGWLPHEQDERKKQCLRNLSSDEAIEIHERPLPDADHGGDSLHALGIQKGTQKTAVRNQDERKDENRHGGYHVGRAVQHVDTTHPWFSMLEACQAEAKSVDDAQLRRLITEQLVDIALLSEPSGPVYHNRLSHHMTMKERMQAMFNQCADFQKLQFNLTIHPMEEWMKLAPCAIRCTLMPCVRGFVFVGLIGLNWAHAVLFYFDGDEQYFFDPSGLLESQKCTNGQTIPEYFKTHHVWIPHPPSHLLHLVDADDMCLSVTCLNNPTPTRKKTKLEKPEAPVAMPWLQMTFGPLSGVQDPLDLRGCCVTMTLLVVLFSLRYGCRNPNFMVKALRCAALDLQTMNPSLYEEFLQRLRGWQNKGTDFNTKPDDFQTLLLMNQCHNGRCNYMVYQPNGSWTLCPNPCSENSAWCANPTHGPKEKRLPGRDRPWNADLNIPLCVGTVGVVGHFDELWNATQEDCAMETMQSQLEELKNNQPNQRGMIYANMPRCKLYGCDEILGDFAKVLGTCQQDDKSEARLLDQSPVHKHKTICGACDDRTSASTSVGSCDLVTLAT